MAINNLRVARATVHSSTEIAGAPHGMDLASMHLIAKRGDNPFKIWDVANIDTAPSTCKEGFTVVGHSSSVTFSLGPAQGNALN